MDERTGERDHVVVVRRTADGHALAHGDGVEEVAAGALAAAVARLEAQGPRWAWDTADVYPALLEAGVRVARAWDLRLGRALLRRAAGTRGTIAALPADGWDELAPVDDGALPLDLGSDLDPVAEHARQAAEIAASERPGALRLLLTAESAGALAAAEMRFAGLPWRRAEHERLLASLLGPRVPADRRPASLERLADAVRIALGAPALNPDSPIELARALRSAGIEVASTRAAELRTIDHPAVGPLLEYKKLARLHAANGWAWLDTWVRDDRFHPEYLVGGVVTGRWAARGGGALQLPKQIRSAVSADDGWRLVVADAAQLEPRVLAGLAHDRAMADAGRGRDLYAGIVASGAVATRQSAKVGMLGALYGATGGEGGRLVPRLAQRFPRALALVEQAAREGERGGTVSTLLGRSTPPVSDRQRALDRDAAVFDADERVLQRARSVARDRGRFTRNFVVQGTAAEWALCWLADLRGRLWELGEGRVEERPHLVYFLHDEVIVHTPAAMADRVAEAVTASAESAGRLLFGDFPIDFPLDVAVVDRYDEAG
ncbi:bifunctional 3'-5' exonuclease/DNA polymerase [Amnibacterium kyonggiense]|uniref:DNA-directed DNA polymerase n=1 Tax=Amnibacterium kyonggiense TaxID=595671 RepID=A0A4R7FM82_9MICO|nr:bifunctional 3'-5' exonuclease/DNA polymerase [Amnibacterium kyonggiense]TDS77561.1 DNA polymerase-1 [Amnibacterium kyonggiense]